MRGLPGGPVAPVRCVGLVHGVARPTTVDELPAVPRAVERSGVGGLGERAPRVRCEQPDDVVSGQDLDHETSTQGDAGARETGPNRWVQVVVHHLDCVGVRSRLDRDEASVRRPSIWRPGIGRRPSLWGIRAKPLRATEGAGGALRSSNATGRNCIAWHADAGRAASLAWTAPAVRNRPATRQQCGDHRRGPLHVAPPPNETTQHPAQPRREKTERPSMSALAGPNLARTDITRAVRQSRPFSLGRVR